MKIPDVNLLVYATDVGSPHHEKATRWLNGLLSGSEDVGLSWSVLIGFIRLSTQLNAFARPLTISTALDVVEAWMALDNVIMLEATNRHTAILRELLEPLGSGGNLVPDAHIAALAIEHGGEVCSADSDFARFPGLRWTNPLQNS